MLSNAVAASQQHNQAAPQLLLAAAAAAAGTPPAPSPAPMTTTTTSPASVQHILLPVSTNGCQQLITIPLSLLQVGRNIRNIRNVPRKSANKRHPFPSLPPLLLWNLLRDPHLIQKTFEIAGFTALHLTYPSL